ncbi:MAG: O-antigen ligase family protein [Mogibacterium sp.]|nr:O-antigen ligase family protein [Mogibacterium sp.]
MIIPLNRESNISSVKRILLAGIVLFSIIPDIGIKLQLAGFTWTAYRLIVPSSLFLVVLLDGFHIRIDYRKYVNRWIVLLCVWLFYGGILFFASSYVEHHDGLIELLSIFNGLAVMYCLERLVKNKQDIEFCIELVLFVLSLNIIIAFTEILTGHHWLASAYNDSMSSISRYENRNMATGFMYNMNDFSAMISCLCPILLFSKSYLKKILLFSSVIIINLINDATICNLAIVIAVGFYCFFLKNLSKKGTIIKRVLAFSSVFGLVFILIMIGTNRLLVGNNLIGAVYRQFSNFQGHTGSLYIRYNVYRESIKAWINSCFLGIGPAGFTNYFIANVKDAIVVNPHSLFLEILTEYGVAILSGFAINLWVLFYGSYKRYTNEKIKYIRRGDLFVMMQVIVYIIASFAPSSFLGYSYQWLIIAISSNMVYFSGLPQSSI